MLLSLLSACGHCHLCGTAALKFGKEICAESNLTLLSFCGHSTQLWQQPLLCIAAQACALLVRAMQASRGGNANMWDGWAVEIPV